MIIGKLKENVIFLLGSVYPNKKKMQKKNIWVLFAEILSVLLLRCLSPNQYNLGKWNFLICLKNQTMSFLKHEMKTTLLTKLN